MLARALRLHNWIKNTLIFVPAVLAKAVNAETLCALLLTWFAFGCAASAQYLLNDFLDKDEDQQDAVKGQRPQVTGELQPVAAAGIGLALIVSATACAVSLPAGSQLALVCYVFLCLAYSLLLKRLLVIDVLTLVMVNDLRLIAGAYGALIALSPSLLFVGSCVFLALALMKRDAQLAAAANGPPRSAAGRPYRRRHLPLLRTLAAAGIVASSVTAPIVIQEFAHQSTRPEAVWFILILLAAALCRSLVLAVRGALQEDLVMFVCTDRHNLSTVAALVALLMVAG
jgi:4-hydroxybenzoate polyprenyltransferase